MLPKNSLVLLMFMFIISIVRCGKHSFSVSHHSKPEIHHTVHHHHIKKYTVVEKIEVPKIKEVPVPYKVYHVEKVPYKYYVNPLIVKVPIEYYNTKTEEFDKHHSTKHDGHKDEEEEITHDHHHDDINEQPIAIY